MPDMTFVPIAKARAVPLRIFAETCVFHNAPKIDAPSVKRNVSP